MQDLTFSPIDYYASQSDNESMQCEPDLWCDEFIQPPLRRLDATFDINLDDTIPDSDGALDGVFEDTGEVLEDGRRIFVLSKKSRLYIKSNSIACMCDTCIKLA